MANSKTEFPIVYWDSCTFISWLDGGIGRTAEEMSGLNSVATEINRGNLRLIASTLTRVETLDLAADDRVERFAKFLTRRKSKAVVVDNPVAEKAGEIRTQCRRRNIKLSAEDAVHLATAIVYEASVFHTFDEKLLGLDGDVGGYPLKIKKPTAEQGTLDLRVTRHQ